MNEPKKQPEFIELTRAYAFAGQVYSTLEAAQAAALVKMLGLKPETALQIAENRESVLNILNMDENSRPKARKINGAVRKRKKAAQEQGTMPLEPMHPSEEAR